MLALHRQRLQRLALCWHGWQAAAARARRAEEREALAARASLRQLLQSVALCWHDWRAAVIVSSIVEEREVKAAGRLRQRKAWVRWRQALANHRKRIWLLQLVLGFADAWRRRSRLRRALLVRWKAHLGPPRRLQLAARYRVRVLRSWRRLTSATSHLRACRRFSSLAAALAARAHRRRGWLAFVAERARQWGSLSHKARQRRLGRLFSAWRTAAQQRGPLVAAVAAASAALRVLHGHSELRKALGRWSSWTPTAALQRWARRLGRTCTLSALVVRWRSSVASALLEAARLRRAVAGVTHLVATRQATEAVQALLQAAAAGRRQRNLHRISSRCLAHARAASWVDAWRRLCALGAFGANGRVGAARARSRAVLAAWRLWSCASEEIGRAHV
jgi:hypothetical protein